MNSSAIAASPSATPLPALSPAEEIRLCTDALGYHLRSLPLTCAEG
ncbi:hypothetical protein K8O92_00050 [Nocardia asteroides]|nr:hypothetical protein [Streptomyces gardneri]UAK32487.1 hypothetical protein K8O92_00050 [Nocardia asteroides]